MARKDQQIYDRLIHEIQQETNRIAVKTIASRIHRVERCINQALTAVLDGEKVDAIDSLLKNFADGFLSIARHHNLQSKTYFSKFVIDYGNVFDAGLDAKFDTVRFRSHSVPPKVVLELLPTDNTLDYMISMYESALNKRIIPAPTEFGVVVQDYPVGFIGPNMGTKDVCLIIPP